MQKVADFVRSLRLVNCQAARAQRKASQAPLKARKAVFLIKSHFVTGF